MLHQHCVSVAKNVIFGLFILTFRGSRPEVFCKEGVLRNSVKCTGKHLCQVSFLIKFQACNFIKKETLTQAFSCELCEIFKNTFC